MESQQPSPAALNGMLVAGKAALASGDRASASQQLHEATQVSQEIRVYVGCDF